jgi:alcohol dehydrogenase class IV
MRFEFYSPQEIIFGSGTLHEVSEIALKLGRRVLVVSGVAAADPTLLYKYLAEKGLDYFGFEVSGEPKIQVINEGIQKAIDCKIDLIIGFGGGSSIDTAKAISIMLTNPGNVMDYLDVIGLGKVLSFPPLPMIAIPTTAGTGAEVTRNAVLTSPEHRMKISLRSPLLLARTAIIDPELTVSMPPTVTATTGMDALVQLIEPFISNRSNPLTDAICREGLFRVARSLQKAYLDGKDRAAREDMALASLFGGLALANAGLGAVHGFASPIGGMFPAPHGAICAQLLTPVMVANIRALSDPSRSPRISAHLILNKYEEISRIITGKQTATLEDGINWLRKLCQLLEIPSLSAYGLTETDITELVEKASVASSMQSNPIKLDQTELQSILVEAM